MQALANHFHHQLSPAPKIDLAVVHDGIRFSVFVSNEVSAEDLCKLDDAVYNAVRGAGRAIEDEQRALDQKLDQVRRRRIDAWDESYFPLTRPLGGLVVAPPNGLRLPTPRHVYRSQHSLPTPGG